MAMLAANLLHSRIDEARSDLADFLSPLRLKNPRTWIALASNSIGFLEKKTTPALRRGGLCDPDTLAEGEACVGEREGERVAMSRDESGEVRALTAYCPHMGVELRYNELEKTWDCPGHGSRFDREGRVICGPAHCNLERLEKLLEKPTAA
jgi:Rieske Fe-S protein